MPIFVTPEPICLQIDLPVGDAWIKASDRADTVVEVRPSNESSKSDVAAAEQTCVEYADGQLVVKTPRSWRRYSPFGPGSSVDVVIELPTGSELQAEAAWASFRCEGQFGRSRFNTSGGIRLDQTGDLDIQAGHGGVTVERAVGHARITTSSGQVRIREADGPAVIKNSSGHCWIGKVTGDVQVNTANGDITIDSALAAVTARTAYGTIRIGEIVRSTAVLQTSYGDIEVGLRAGTAAWLDVSSRHGRVFNALRTLSPADAPAQAAETAEIRAQTSYGNITISRP